MSSVPRPPGCNTQERKFANALQIATCNASCKPRELPKLCSTVTSDLNVKGIFWAYRHAWRRCWFLTGLRWQPGSSQELQSIQHPLHINEAPCRSLDMMSQVCRGVRSGSAQALKACSAVATPLHTAPHMQRRLGTTSLPPATTRYRSCALELTFSSQTTGGTFRSGFEEDVIGQKGSPSTPARSSRNPFLQDAWRHKLLLQAWHLKTVRWRYRGSHV